MSRGVALITGASSGIGAELAKLCAADGYDLILIARREDLLQQLADDLVRRHGIGAHVLAVDLADPAARESIFQAARDQPVEILINNAGFGVYGPFIQTDWDEENRLIQVNMTAVAHLTKLFLRRWCGVVAVASLTSLPPRHLSPAR